MSESNRPFQVLVVNSGGTFAAADASVNNIALNQLGLYDNATGKCLDPANPITSAELYLALGIDPKLIGQVGDVAFSAGQFIPLKGIKAIRATPYVTPANQIFQVNPFTAETGTEYGLKLEVRNMQVYARQGTNQYSKSYFVTTLDADALNTEVDANFVVSEMVKAINTDQEAFVTARAVATTALTVITHGVSKAYSIGDTMLDTDVLALVDFNAAQTNTANKVFAAIQIEANPLGIRAFCDVNLLYYEPRQTVIVPSLIEGFKNTDVVEVQEAVAEQGKGYDIKQLEYKAGGWNGKPGPYRASSATGLAMPGFFYLAKETTKYNIYDIVYEVERRAGWGTYSSELHTIVAVDTTATTVMTALNTLVQKLVAATNCENNL